MASTPQRDAHPSTEGPHSGTGDLADAYDVCAFDDLKLNGALSFTFRRKDKSRHGIGVFWDGEEVYAIDNLCPHGDAFLHAGDIIKRRVICPLHRAVFDLRSGECLTRFTNDVETHTAEVRDDRVWVHLPGEIPFVKDAPR
jgi:nitrite reductase/ring-hydroxylating ferredoxin subunit